MLLRRDLRCHDAHRARRRARAWVLVASSAALAAAGLAAAGGASAAGAPSASSAASAATAATAATAAREQPARPAAHAGYRRACPVATRRNQMACMVLLRANVAQQAQRALRRDAAPAGVGYGPSSLQSAYQLPSSIAGIGQTVAVVDAYDDPSAASDLATYRADWGLPPCGAGCFRKVNQTGQASPLPAASGRTGWATEESLDLDMVSAICPNCHIILVEASSTSVASLGAGVNAAVSLGAAYVSNSYGGAESPADPAFDAQYYKHPGVAVTASAGDGGYGVTYPAASQYVTAVGGTSLTMAPGSRGWTESAWGSAAGGEGTGSGCSADDAKPAWQHDAGCAKRTANDVAAVASPSTGVAVYDSYDQRGWLEVGGTSASAPIIAATYALAGPPAAGSYPASYPYQHTAGLFDVTSGANGACATAYFCRAQAGYDGPTGWGTPDGSTAFRSTSTGGGGGGGGGGGCPAGQLLGNPGFESGAIAPWTSTAGLLTRASAGVPAHGGSWLAWLDGYGSAHADTLAQTVTIPASCTTANLSFWLDISTNDPAGRAYDTFTAQVLSPAGAVLATLATYSNQNATRGYVQHTFSLVPYLGQKVTIRFTGTETLAGHVTSFFEDDNALSVS